MPFAQRTHPRARLDKLETDEGLGVIAEDAAALLGETFPSTPLQEPNRSVICPHKSGIVDGVGCEVYRLGFKERLTFPFGESDTPSNNELPEILLAAVPTLDALFGTAAGFARQLAVSSGGSRLVLTTVADGGRLRRLVMLSTDQEELRLISPS